MPYVDLPQHELERYRTSTPEPAELDAWWHARLDEARSLATSVSLVRHAAEVYGDTSVWDMTFSGADGSPVRAWYVRPAGRAQDEPLPTVVTFIGYGGGRGVPTEHLVLPAVGFAHVVMDTRGQGGKWTVGATGDPGRAGEGPEHPGVMTRGIERPESYYYTRLYVDAVRAVDEALAMPGVDATRLAVAGTSQGGGLALAAAALCGDRVRVCQADVPFLCDFRRGITFSPSQPYVEIAEFLALHVDLIDAAQATLAYVDCALLARRITATTLLSVGLMDDVCPASTVYAAYNEISAPKELVVYQFGTHTLPRLQEERRIRHLRQHL